MRFGDMYLERRNVRHVFAAERGNNNNDSK